MTRIHLKKRNGIDTVVEATNGISLMENVQRVEPGELLAVCGGSMSCGTCHVFVHEDDFPRVQDISEEEDFLLDISPLRRPTSRLACQIVVGSEHADLRIETAPED